MNALILMGYLEQVKAVVTTTSASSAVSTGSVYQNNFWQAGYEYMTLANTIVTNNSYVGNATSAAVVTCSNQIANHLFLTWYNLDNAAQLIDDSTVLVHGPGGGEWDGEVIRELIGDIASGDGVKFTVNGAVFESYIADVHVVMENSQSIGNDKAILRIHLQSPVPLVIVNQCHDDKIAVSIKKYGQVGQLLTKSMSICSVILGPSTKTGSISCSAVNRSMHALKSESCYLLGRLHHLLHQNESSHSKLSDAIAHYELCLLHGGLHLESKSTDTICNSSIVSLAMYQLGQIYLSQQEFVKSLDMFEFLIKFRQEKDNKEMNSRSEAQSLLLHNQNRDVSAYIMLIKSMQRQEICESFDELADAVASGSFPYAFELWLSQAQLRVYKGMDSTGSPKSEAYLSALKCFDRACQCLNGIVSESRISGRPLTAVQQQQVAELPLIYANMASVYHALGNTFKSYEFNCLSLKSLASEQENVDEGDSDLLAGSRTVFHHAENSMFYKWIECDGSYRFRYNSEASVGDSLRFDVVNSKANGEDLDACVFDTDLFVNNDVMINGVLCTITETVTEDVRDKQPETAADEDAMEVSSGGGGMYDDIEDQVSEVVIQKQSKKRVVSIAVTSLILKLRMENDRDEAEAIARLRLEAAEKAKAEAAREVEDDLFGDEDETDAPANVDADSFTVPEYVIRYKASLNNATNINVVFNMARILEDKGATTAAIELYTFLLKMHPMYIECYVRLGVIQKELGNIENGIHWMKKALECIEKHSQDTPAEDAESVNATLNIGIHKNNCHMLLGYMYAINGNMDRGQKEFDVVCRKVQHVVMFMCSLLICMIVCV